MILCEGLNQDEAIAVVERRLEGDTAVNGIKMMRQSDGTYTVEIEE